MQEVRRNAISALSARTSLSEGAVDTLLASLQDSDSDPDARSGAITVLRAQSSLPEKAVEGILAPSPRFLRMSLKAYLHT
jgi:hypothetical protein